MNIWQDKDFPIVVSVAKTLAPWTERELIGLGYRIVDKSETVVVIRGSLRDVFRLNLWLHTAHRVLVPLLRTQCRHVRELYDKVGSIDWENLIAADGYFSVSSVVHNSTIRDTRLPSLVTKDAVVDKIRMKTGRRPDSGPDYDQGACVFIHWDEDSLIVYLDTSGAPLSKRGYRKIPGSAPMQETLAAACVSAMEWKGSSPFVFPMCGSGTPAIEAALVAMNRAPGSLRSRFGFMGIKGYSQMIPGEKAPRAAPRQRFGVSPEQIWKDMVMEAAEQERTSVPPIIATDISPEAIQNVEINAHAAGVFNQIKFSACDFAETALPPFEGGEHRPCIFVNPEYGIRLGTEEELKPLYDRIGQYFADSCRGWTCALITGNPTLAQMVNLKYKHRIPFYNGPIDCRLFIYEL